jgi:hypothetical protein
MSSAPRRGHGPDELRKAHVEADAHAHAAVFRIEHADIVPRGEGIRLLERDAAGYVHVEHVGLAVLCDHRPVLSKTKQVL